MELFLGAKLRQAVDDRPEVGAAIAEKIFDPPGAQNFQIRLPDGLHGNRYGSIHFHESAPRIVLKVFSNEFG
jgi:hypothetical protein